MAEAKIKTIRSIVNEINFVGHNLLSVNDLTDDQIYGLFDLALVLEPFNRSMVPLLTGNVMSTLFFQPSTRTRMSFETAMHRLGGAVISEANPMVTSSAAKEESLSDMLKVVSKYANIIVMRHFNDVDAREAAPYSDSPVVNGGWGHWEHPTQALLDLYTLYRTFGRIKGLKVCVASADLIEARTGHSMAQGLARLGAEVVLASPKEKRIPEEVMQKISKRGIHVEEAFDLNQDSFNELVSGVDMIYLPGCSAPKGAEAEAFKAVMDNYFVRYETLDKVAKDENRTVYITHTLPRRAGEMDLRIDNSPSQLYFEAIAYSVAIRMALVSAILGVEEFMRIVVTIDGELLASLGYNTGLKEQKAAIASMVESMGNLLARGDEIVICHGNAPQVGAMLLRSEAARHMIYVLPLDVCGADTQGATGYMFQQALQNWLNAHAIEREVVTIITQVEVEAPVEYDPTVVLDRSGPDEYSPKKGVGPFFDKELAQSHHITRGWELSLVSGFGYQRLVPLLKPLKIVEGKSIRTLVDNGSIIICTGGGGIPVRIDPQGQRVGVEAVVDKAYTSVLLAQEIQAESILFVTPLENLLGILGPGTDTRIQMFDLAKLEGLIQGMALNDPIRHISVASRDFLQAGGKSVLIVPSGELGILPQANYGVFLGSGDILVFNHWISANTRSI